MEFITTQNDYIQIRELLNTYTGVFWFQKKNGEKRVLIGTRNEDTIESLSGQYLRKVLEGHDRRNTFQTGTISLIDLSIFEPRSIPINRLYGIKWFGALTRFNCDEAYQYYHNLVNYNANLTAQEKRQELSEMTDGFRV